MSNFFSNKFNQFKADLIGKAGDAIKPAKTPASSGTLAGPWVTESVQGSFFEPIEIDGKRWDQLFPYRLLVVKAISGNTYKAVTNGSSGTFTEITHQGTGSWQISFQPMSSEWSYQLPITPQQLSITNAFAISNNATLRGVVEEHGGTKYKLITCNGTFGVWPYRSNKTTLPANPTFSQTLFGGSLQAFSALKTQVSNLQTILSGKTAANRLPSPDVNKAIGGYAGTGYAQALLLDQFLEQYAELKKKPENSDWRLAFDIPKQNQTFLVTPIQFTYSQSADSPNEHKFALQLKAFKRVKLDKPGKGIELTLPKPTESNSLQKVLRSITQARQVLGASYNLVRAVRSDVNGPFNALREAAVVVKDLAGLATTVADLPKNIIEDTKFTLADAVSQLPLDNGLKAKLQSDIKDMKLLKGSNEGQPLGNASSKDPNFGKTSPVSQLFAIPEKSFELLNLLDTSSINFSPSAKDAIEKEMDRLSLITVDDLNKHKATLQDLATQISNAFGTGDETYSRVYGKPAPKSRLQEISIDEYDILKKLYDVIQDLSLITQTDEINANQNAAYEFVKSEAQDAGLTFVDSTSKVRYPVPFGLSIEQIAARYLGDQERWIEIATLNALNSPYIDENGFTRDFLSNGNGRQFNISSIENMYVGQKINILSSTQPRQKRSILDIEKINSSNYLITVDGLDNLDIFTTANSAKILAYLPGTVNSQDQIFVPSDLPVGDDLITRPIPATQDDVLTGMSKVDLLLDDNNDIAVNSFGDFRLSYGLTNLFQALKIKFMTDPGQIMRHPEFGAGLQHGMSNADVSANNIYNTMSALIAQDPRYAGIDSFQVNIDGPTVYVSLTVLAANGLGVFPVSFQLN